MEAAHKYVESLLASSTKIDQIEKDINDLVRGEYRYKLDFILKTYVSLFDRFCPFKVGDRVQLKQAPEISKDVAWGWLGAKHFLIVGAVATVTSLDYRGSSFLFGLKFDDESFIGLGDKLQLVEEDRRSIFMMSENFLERSSID